jgi:DNA polymerase III epsilon subunit-like protein
MKTIPFLEIYDFEATDLFNPEPTQIGLVGANSSLDLLTANSEYIKPTGNISYPAMGITGITLETVANAMGKEYVLSDDYIFFPSEETTYIASYNWNFDKQFIPESWLVGKKVICLLKLARTFVDKQLTGDHKLSTLWYYYGHYKTKNYGNSHDAQTDCKMTLDVLKSILEENNLTLDQAYNLLYDPTVCKGGKKYPRGTRWEDIIVNDYDYVEYTFNNVDLDQDEKLYLEGLLSQYEGVKLEQVKTCSKKKYAGRLWSDVVKEDRDYVNFLLKNGHLKGDELEWVKGLLSTQ